MDQEELDQQKEGRENNNPIQQQEHAQMESLRHEHHPYHCLCAHALTDGCCDREYSVDLLHEEL